MFEEEKEIQEKDDDISDEHINEADSASKLAEESANIPLSGGPPEYPRIFWGESAKPLSGGNYPNSSYIDDNISRTWQGLMSVTGQEKK